MGLISLTQTSSGASFSLEENDVLKVYDRDSQTIVEYVSGENSRIVTQKVGGSASDTASLFNNLVSTTYNGGTVYLNAERIVEVSEVASKAWVSFDNNGDKPEILKLDVDKSTFEAAIPSSAPSGYKVYVAKLTQTGTSAPTALILENTLGATPTWSYDSVGNYSATIPGGFTEAKTTVMHGSRYASSSTAFYHMYVWTDDVIYIEVINDSGGASAPKDGELEGTEIEIRIYD